jgi:hypothetical protein
MQCMASRALHAWHLRLSWHQTRMQFGNSASQPWQPSECWRQVLLGSRIGFPDLELMRSSEVVPMRRVQMRRVHMRRVRVRRVRRGH